MFLETKSRWTCPGEHKYQPNNPFYKAPTAIYTNIYINIKLTPINLLSKHQEEGKHPSLSLPQLPVPSHHTAPHRSPVASFQVPSKNALSVCFHAPNPSTVHARPIPLCYPTHVIKRSVVRSAPKPATAD